MKLKDTGSRFNHVASDQAIEQTKSKHEKSHGRILGYSTVPGTVHCRLLASHIITHCELQLGKGVFAKPHSQMKDISKSQMNFDQSCVDVFLEVLK